MNFREKLARFFYGRYGIDELYYFLFILYFIIWFALVFIGFWPLRLALYALQAACIVWMFFRVLSRNVYARRKENAVFLKVWNPVKNFFILQKNRIRDAKSYRYRKCPHCKAVLRLPKRKGEHPVVCPRCKKRFNVKVRF